ncbi:MAG: FecR family protein [Prevotella sp.]|jgi:ferric-dicitrate binding protein FerR (iron transport regulator)
MNRLTKEEIQSTIPYLICKYLTGTLSEEESLLLEQWRQASKENEAVFQRLLNTEQLDRERLRMSMVDYQRPLDDMKRHLGLFDMEQPENHWHWQKVVAIAASIMLVVAIGAGWWLKVREEQKPQSATTIAQVTDIQPGHTQAVLTLDDGQQIPLTDDSKLNEQILAKASKKKSAMNHLSTPRGGEFKVTLEDGTEVWLNADSKLSYPEKFGETERRVELEGEAYFKVTKNPEKPFYVVSGSQEVRVYGTEFNVEAYSDDDLIYTTLVKGSVSLKSLHTVKGEVMLSPGHQALFSPSTETARIRKVDTDVVTSWRKGMFVFENQNMAQIMKQLSRWYDFDYKFADTHVADIVFMGSIPRYSSFNEVVDVFSKVGGIRLTRHGKTVIVSAE